VLDELRVRSPRIDHIDSKSLSLFTENKFHSVRTLAQELGVSLSTVYDRLVTVLGFSLRHARLVLHLLIEELKAQRIATSVEIMLILQT
jgi:AraC-like DNA-binding protein